MLVDKNEISIEFALENDFDEILKKITLFFEKEDDFFKIYVPTLYKEGKNTYKNHIVAKYQNKIVGVLAFVVKDLYALNQTFRLAVVGSICVDKNFRNLGIMTNMFNLLYKTYDDKIDVYALLGKEERYRHYGFSKIDESKLYHYEKKDFGYSFVLMNEDNYVESLSIYNTLEYRVNRDDIFFDSLRMWYDQPYLIYKDKEYLGYLTYNFRNDRVEEVCLNKDYSFINDIMQSFAFFKNIDLALKITKQNLFIERKVKHIKELSFLQEKCLCRILNPKLEGVYIPRHDLI